MPEDPLPIPVVDIAPLVSSGDRERVATEIDRACRESGFFYVVGHGVDDDLQLELERATRQFFSQDLESKLAIRMELGGRAWRGYFPVGAELTLGRPDQKEGIYFGSELADDHPKVAAATPMHGRNLFPDIPGYRETVLEYMDAMTRLGHALMEGIALGLGLQASYFADRYTSAPLILFRAFNYPSIPGDAPQDVWSVAEHTDYGMLTMLRQDGTCGLQVKSRSAWIDAPPIPGSFVCNIGDMLDRMTAGHYHSTPHRVRNSSGRDRMSFPFFFDPSFDAEVEPIELKASVADDEHERWDGVSVHELQGTYGDYLLRKVSKVFPELGREIL